MDIFGKNQTIPKDTPLYLKNNNEKILLTTMLTIKILFTINSLKKKEKTIHSKTLFTIPVDLKSA